MQPNRRITRAYCVQFDEEVTIVAARREYFSLEPPRKRFDFLCSHEECRAAGVKITGVNYDIEPQETPRFQSAHFRANSRYEHEPSCEWIEAGTDDEPGGALPGESDADARTRKVKRKLNDYIDVFDPIPRDATPKKGDTGQGEGSVDPEDADGAGGRERRAGGEPGTRRSQTRTSNLERLVESYREAKAELPADEFNALTLRVPGQGEVALRAYFRHIKQAAVGDNGCVLLGGALVERYGLGFKFKFFDRLANKPVFLYVSKERMGAYRFRRYLDALLNHKDSIKYFTVYALGRVVENPSGKSFNLEVDDLLHLAIVLGPAKEPSETEGQA